MLFSVDAHAIGRQLTGNEVYIRNLLRGFAALDQDAGFLAYVCPNCADGVPERFQKRTISEHSFLRLGVDLTRQLRRDRPDLVHVQYTAPLGCPVPVVVSIHDVSFIEHPEYFSWARSTQLRMTVRRTAQAAARVVTPSEFSRRSVARVYGLDDARVAVVPIAVSASFRPVSRDAARAWAGSRYGLGFPFFLTVGDLQPRKNQIGLIRAFEELVRDQPQLPHHLVIVGQERWFSGRVYAAARASSAASRIHFTGFVNDDDLLQLYNACEVFVFPSFYEGFGLPVLEAMACGRAVACSNTTAIPEVADACALTFDPYSTAQIVRAMRDLALDAELRARMERLGLQRASSFTWERTAKETLEIYYEVAGASRSQGALRAIATPL